MCIVLYASGIAGIGNICIANGHFLVAGSFVVGSPYGDGQGVSDGVESYAALENELMKENTFACMPAVSSSAARKLSRASAVCVTSPCAWKCPHPVLSNLKKQA